MIELLRQLLDLRETLHRLADRAGGYGVIEGLPEIAQMQALERQMFEKVNEWDKPDPEELEPLSGMPAPSSPKTEAEG